LIGYIKEILLLLDMLDLKEFVNLSLTPLFVLEYCDSPLIFLGSELILSEVMVA